GPSTRFFTTLYPKPIVLSSGTSFSLPVTFRPLEKDQYEDNIEFETNNGIFSIPMRAVLPRPDVSIPESLHFGMCAVKDSIALTFEVKNTSELMTSFQWELSEPFIFVPSSGTLSPKTSCLIKATFTPKAALVYEAIAVCKYAHDMENTDLKSMKIEGIGKFPHIVASTLGQKRSTISSNGHEVVVDFGEVPVQTTAEKTIELHNFSPVSAPFQILQPSLASNIDTVFSCSQFHGVVAPSSTARLKVSFSPHAPGLHSTDTLEVVVLGATNCSVVKCVGIGKGPSVSLDNSYLDFAVVEAGKQITRTFKIENSSSVPAVFQFLIDCSQSVFKLNSTCGMLSGGGSKTLVVHFIPSHPINYNRRLVCLVQNQSVRQSTYPSIHQSVYSSVHPPIHLSVNLVSPAVHLSVTAVNPSVHPPIHLSVNLVSPTVHLSVTAVSPLVHPPIHLSVNLVSPSVSDCSQFISPPTHPSVSQSSKSKSPSVSDCCQFVSPPSHPSVSQSSKSNSPSVSDCCQFVSPPAHPSVSQSRQSNSPSISDCSQSVSPPSHPSVSQSSKSNSPSVSDCCQFVSPPAHPSVSQSRQSNSPSISDCSQSVSPSVHPPIHLSVSQSSKSNSPSVSDCSQFISPPAHLSVNLDPLFIDLFGTCHTEQVKPAPLQRKHLLRYHTHVSRGLSKISPEGISVSTSKDTIPLTQLTPMEELFNDGSFGETCLVVPHVSLDIQHLSFGRVPDSMGLEQKTVNITNHTKGKITCQWMKDTKGIFSVFPESCDVIPLRTASFQVTFRPDASNQFFSAELECYVFYKSTRDYRLIEDNSFCPPWCLTLNTSGQTFTIGAETFLPRYELDTRNMVFPAITPDQVSYRTLLLANTGTNAISFAFDDDPDRIFSCRPSKGLLTDKYQLVAFRMMPPEARVFKHTLKCRLNDVDKFTQEINMIGSAEVPRVQLEGEGTLYFKSTCIGTSSIRPLSVKNTSRISLRFYWRVPGVDAKVLAIEPQNGIIKPNETQVCFNSSLSVIRATKSCNLSRNTKITQHIFVLQAHSVTFTPHEETKYLIKPKLFVSSSLDDKTNSGSDIKNLVRVIGEGAVGEIICTEPSVDLGDIVVGGSLSKDLTIHNNSDCSLHYDMIVDQEIQGPYDDEETIRDVLAIEVNDTRGIIPARTSKKINATVFPARRVNYKFLLSYILVSTHDEDKRVITRRKTSLAELYCQGVYPTLSVSDVRGLGSNKGLSKVKLWNLFSLDRQLTFIPGEIYSEVKTVPTVCDSLRLNECLDSDPSPPELMYAAATRHSTKRRVPVYTRAVMDFNFGAAPTGSDPSIIHFNLHNTGSVPAEWAFLYPSDLQLELDYWAETGEYEPDELHEMQVMDNKLFMVEPKKGKLLPGVSQTLTLTYKHLFTGTNKLPVIFKIMKGREILLNFIGVTVDEESRYVHFASTNHMFEPVPVGINSPPVQIYELYNGGALSVNYELDLEPLAQLEGQNYGCRILDCLNPSGEIPPGCTALIHWVFAPLEAKTYMVDIPIRIIGGDTVLVTFTGVGYDQRIMGDTMLPRESVSAGVPSKQIVPVHYQLACLSIERMAFGNLPLYSICRRNVFISNSSADHVISFRWIVEGTPAEQVMMIEPIHGYLHPGQSTLLKISFFSTGPPSMNDLDVLCEVVDETEMADFNQRLIDWTNKQEERQYTFTIKEDDVKADKTTKRRPRSGPRLKSIDNNSQSSSKSDGDLQKYHALPPIAGAEKRDEKTGTKKKTKKSKSEEQPMAPQPTPPESFWLHLGITARTHSISEFHTNFSSETTNFLIDQRFVLNQEASADKQDLSALVTCTRPQMGVVTDILSVILRPQMGVVTDILSVILRGLLYGENFHKSLVELTDEPVPYFRQLCETPFTYNESRPSTSGSEGQDYEETPRRSKTPDQEPPETPVSISQEYDDKAISKTHEIVQRSVSALSVVDHLKDQNLDPEWKANQRQKSKNLPEFQSLIEAVLENTLHNVLTEASCGEVNLSARPRVIALPPSRVIKTNTI
ncbi:hypothetical protein QZH41_012071, partial [Actinostola sp. cb2023]